MRASTRLAALGSAGLLALAIALGGCAPGTSTSGTPASASVQLTPSSTAAPKAAEQARLPDQLAGWSPSASPTMLPTDLDNVRVRVQTAVFHDASGKDSRIVTLVITPDKGYAQSQRKSLSDQQVFSDAVCGTPSGVPNAVSCLIDLDGGLLQTTGTGQDAADLASFTNGIYASFQ